MENKLEQLLNSLIEKGWKPRWEKVNKVIKTWIDEFGDGYVLFDGELNWYKQRWCNMTELVSKSSWLWQFVCENYLIELNWDEIEKKYKSEWEYPLRYEKHYWVYHSDLCRQEFIKYETPEFWIIESALCDEDKLEEFLLSNINIKW
jgi:hypothetical protein